ncbi:MAG: 4Fe-4S binding protein [Bacteroidales bacterium]|nr:4Fe-4S binding protein [Bacteroidales bacterium]
MSKTRMRIQNLIIVFVLGLIPAIICQFYTQEPVDRYIHIRNFRYGKDPAVIRCNRGDTLHLTFSSDDTGHSFFLEEFDIDVKVSPAVEEVTVFKTSDPSATPFITKELTIIAEHPGVLNYVISKSQYRCHVWCGPMHAFEQGKLLILPNTLLCFSLGSFLGVILIWVLGLFGRRSQAAVQRNDEAEMKDLFKSKGILKKLLVSRWPQFILTLIALTLIYIVIMTSLFGTKMSGRNLGVLLMWAVWLFLIIAIMTPFAGRIWCTICPLPMFGDLIQRGSFFSPRKGRTKGYNNKFFGLSLKWPQRLSNNWLRLIVFLILATFSTTMVASPRISGLTILALLLLPTLMAPIFELRAFCRYVCPVHAFIGPFSGMSKLALRNRSQEVCDNCKAHFCQNGNAKGWACPYGLNVAELKENANCGLCLECIRSCTYDNVTLYKRPFASERSMSHMSDAWLSIAIFTIGIIYSILYLGHWPVVRDYVNILDKKNWDLFGIYTGVVWSMSLLIMPGLLYGLAYAGGRLSKQKLSARKIFLNYTASLLPIGLMLWMAFVIPMLFTNITFVLQSLSDPFGWGWDFFGTANTPWHQLIPRYIPWIQAILILAGLHLSLRNITRSWQELDIKPGKQFLITLPYALFIALIALGLLFFFTN